MDPIGPSSGMPLRLARAYGATRQEIAPCRPATPTEAVSRTDRLRIRAMDAADSFEPAHKLPGRAGRLIAAVIPGRVDFSADEPAPTGAALPLYRHPADRNAAGTALSAGRIVDVSG